MFYLLRFGGQDLACGPPLDYYSISKTHPPHEKILGQVQMSQRTSLTSPHVPR